MGITMKITNTVSKTDAARRFFDVPQKYLARSYNIRTRAYIVRKLLGDLRSTSILDIGCGDGSISRQFLSDSNRLTLLDLSKNMLHLARNHTPPEHLNGTRYINNDFVQCGFVDEFDVVLCLGVLAHVDSVAETIRAISTSLKKGGRCVLQITDEDSFFFKVIKTYSAIRRAKPAELGYVMNPTTSSMITTLATQNGLQLLKQYRYSLMMPGMHRLSDSFLFRYQVATVESKWISRLGLDVLFLFSKE